MSEEQSVEDRLRQEFEDLTDKIYKLDKALVTHPLGISEEQLALMRIQRPSMLGYSLVLQARLKRTVSKVKPAMIVTLQEVLIGRKDNRLPDKKYMGETPHVESCLQRLHVLDEATRKVDAELEAMQKEANDLAKAVVEANDEEALAQLDVLREVKDE